MPPLTDDQRQFLVNWVALTDELGQSPSYVQYQNRYNIRYQNSITVKIRALAMRGLMVQVGQSWIAKTVDYMLYNVRSGGFWSEGKFRKNARSADRFTFQEAEDRAVMANQHGKPVMAIVPVPFEEA